MSNGSMQFLGRQLSEQAQALALLVEKMQEVINSVDNVVPKFAIASDNIKYSKEINVTNSSQYQLLLSQISGVLRVKNNSEYSVSITIIKNGVTTIDTIAKNGYGDLQVIEGDEIKIVTNGYPRLVKVDICYDLADKPDIII